jgi:hypothetical protein
MELATTPDGDDRHAADRSLTRGWGSAVLQGSGEPTAEGSMHHVLREPCSTWGWPFIGWRRRGTLLSYLHVVEPWHGTMRESMGMNYKGAIQIDPAILRIVSYIHQRHPSVRAISTLYLQVQNDRPKEYSVASTNVNMKMQPMQVCIYAKSRFRRSFTA